METSFLPFTQVTFRTCTFNFFVKELNQCFFTSIHTLTYVQNVNTFETSVTYMRAHTHTSCSSRRRWLCVSSPGQRVKEELQNLTVAPVSSPCRRCLLPSNTFTSLVVFFLYVQEDCKRMSSHVNTTRQASFFAVKADLKSRPVGIRGWF